MPRDSHLLPPHSQALLRAARSGNVFRPPPQPLEDEKEGLPGEDEDGGDGDIGGTERGYVAKKWTVVPRHLEGPEPEYLARRRKGLPSMYLGPLAVGTMGPMRKVKVRKTDAEGQTSVWEVLAPEGQVVEGEIFEDVEMTEAPAPGTVVEGVGVVNADGLVVAGDVMMQPTPPRRRPPPPRRKPKGPGRGRRKKVQFAAGGDGSNRITTVGSSADITMTKEIGHQTAEGIKTEVLATEGTANGGGDAEMADDSLLQDGEEEDDENEDGEEGEEGDDDDREEGELSPSPDPDAPGSLSGSPSKPPPPPSIEVTAARISPVGEHTFPTEPKHIPPITRDPSSSPELPLAASHGNPPPSDEVVPQIPQATVTEVRPESEATFSDGEVDLFGSLERHLEGKGKSHDQAEASNTS